jgi:hypothetical protein
MIASHIASAVAASLCRGVPMVLLFPVRRRSADARAEQTYGTGHRKPFAVLKARTHEAFTLAEVLISVFVLAIILLVAAQLLSNAAAVGRMGHKHVSTDTQAREVFDRMALDFAQMVKRTDVDYYVKQRTNYTGHGNGHGWGRGHNSDLGSDQMAFFTHVPGYYPSGPQSPISLVAYRVNQSSSSNPAYLRLERLGRGLLWNGVNFQASPLVFLPVTIGSLWPWAVNNNNNCGGSGNTSCDPDGYYEIIGPGVFRFEYYYVLKNGMATDWPWDRWELPDQQSITSPVSIGLNRVEAIGVSIAVIDSAGRALIDAANPGSLLDLASDLADFKSARGRGVGNQTRYIGMVEADWENTVETIAATGYTSTGLPVPPEAARGIRVYGRIFDLKTLSTF